MFSAISINMSDGIPTLGGSIGDTQGFTSLEFSPFERALIYKVRRRLQQTSQVTGGEVQISGDVELQLKVITEDDDQGSAVASLAVLLVVQLFSSLWAEWMVGSEVAGSLGSRGSATCCSVRLASLTLHSQKIITVKLVTDQSLNKFAPRALHLCVQSSITKVVFIEKTFACSKTKSGKKHLLRIVGKPHSAIMVNPKVLATDVKPIQMHIIPANCDLNYFAVIGPRSFATRSIPRGKGG